MKIGELARRTGCPVRTIRFYGQAGLLAAAARSEGNFRVYRESDVERLSFIRNCRGLDMTLDEIRALLRFKDAGGADCGDVDALLDEHIAHVEQRITELRALSTQLVALRATCGRGQDIAECGILRGLSETQPDTRVEGAHVPGTHTRVG